MVIHYAKANLADPSRFVFEFDGATYDLSSNAGTLVNNLITAHQRLLNLPFQKLTEIIHHILRLNYLEGHSAYDEQQHLDVRSQYLVIQSSLDKAIEMYARDTPLAVLNAANRNTDDISLYLRGLANQAEDA